MFGRLVCKSHVTKRCNLLKIDDLWGKDVSIENLHQGFTHIFESTFESTEGVAEYVAHPTHVEYADLLLSHLDKVLIFDYKPTTLRC
ncbi:hypothetical protein Ddye_018969 [Dipteronia dyeriana]|uniref:Stress-response A/B barrel domain-containing protein n=1 Tax=Dipteronia dyeriana TaxID=168575 RepID=A0AAD9TXZ0_9ROSI|nr:hypothetical protein Ddye_018969 [Dipteronia dyeriana]